MKCLIIFASHTQTYPTNKEICSNKYDQYLLFRKVGLVMQVENMKLNG